MNRPLALRLGLLLAAALACSDRSPRVASGDVLLITIDTLRPDHMGLYGYPRATTPKLDARFANALVFDRAYSAEANTPSSVASILSGRLPQDHGVRLFYQLLPEHVRLIPDWLPESYQTAAFVSNVVLTEEALGIAERFDHYDDRVDQPMRRRAVYERNARRTTDAALEWLAEARDPARPLFLWVHYIDPHGPYGPPQDWPRSFRHERPQPIDVGRMPPYEREPGVDDGAAYVDLYDEEIAYVDAHVDRLLAGYAERAALEQALVIFSADHGESMMEHERWFTHGYHVYEEIVRVPLVLLGPGVAPGRSAALASGLDVAPTVLAFAGAEIPSELPGFDLRSHTSIPPERLVLTEATESERQWRAAIGRERKWLVALHGAERGVLEQRLYQLADDPGELSPLPWAGADPGAAALLQAIATDPDPSGMPTRYRKGMRLSAPKVSPDVSPEQLERLRALGYAE